MRSGRRRLPLLRLEGEEDEEAFAADGGGV